MAGEDLHDLVLPRELELLEALLLHLLLRGEVELLLQRLELPLEVVVLVVVVPELRLTLEQGGDQLLVLSLPTKTSAGTRHRDGNTPENGLSTRGARRGRPRQLGLRRSHVERLDRAQLGARPGRQQPAAQPCNDTTSWMIRREGARDEPGPEGVRVGLGGDPDPAGPRSAPGRP